MVARQVFIEGVAGGLYLGEPRTPTLSDPVAKSEATTPRSYIPYTEFKPT